MSKIMVVSFQSLTATSGQGMARLGYALSKELHKRGLLKAFIVNSKGKFETPFPSEPVSFFSRYYLFILNKLNNIFNFKTHKFRFLQELLFDWFCAMKIDNSISILFSTQPYMKRTFRKAQKLNITTILLPGTPEDDYIYNIVSEENKKLNSKEIDAYTYDKRNRYFKASMKHLDIVIGFFPTVYQSYQKSIAFQGKSVELVGHITVDLPEFNIKDKKPKENKFVVGFLSYVVVLKGLQYLLEAWKKILAEHNIKDIELLIGGPLNPIMKSYIDKHFKGLAQVKYLGHVSDIAGFMQEIDLFVIPSLVDAGPLTALEAAHYGVPSVITNNSGSSALVGKGDCADYIIPIRDAKAIEEKILWAYHNRDKNTQLGVIAKQTVAEYSFDEYIIRLGNYIEEVYHGK